jgi:N-acetylglucosaminyldiphosphoundecaprenol N-acetyl-beta-D-mannosaminyltransferase
MEALLHAATSRGYRVFLLGARSAVVERAEMAIEAQFPGIVIAGSHHGYFTRAEEEDVVGLVAASAPDILFVALETPAKELFLARNRSRLGVPFVMGVGGAFDVLAGERRRAPRLFQRLGLEWLYRLAQDPRRLARRYVVGNSKFVWLVLREFARTRIKSEPPPAEST